ncbi:MAG: hypothetical protein ABIL11_06245 [Chloroflexota bacterium]
MTDSAAHETLRQAQCIARQAFEGDEGFDVWIDVRIDYGTK